MHAGDGCDRELPSFPLTDRDEDLRENYDAATNAAAPLEGTHYAGKLTEGIGQQKKEGQSGPAAHSAG